MVVRHGIQPVEKDYLSMLKLTQKLGDLRFYDVLASYMDDLLIPVPAAWGVLEQWFLGSTNGFYEVSVGYPSASGVLQTGKSIRLASFIQ